MRPIVSRFGRYRDQVEWMTLDGEPLSSVEEMLNGAPLSADERDALWLVAWGLRQRLEDGYATAMPSRSRPVLASL
jgi:hypothetical protein